MFPDAELGRPPTSGRGYRLPAKNKIAAASKSGGATHATINTGTRANGPRAKTTSSSKGNARRTPDITDTAVTEVHLPHIYVIGD